MLNKVQLIGRVGKDPEVKDINGNKVANFSLATSEKYKDKQGAKQERTEWHNITIWGRLAEVVEKYVNKGDLLYLEGKIQTRSWDDKDGNKKYITEIHCFTMQMLGGGESKPQAKTEPQRQMKDANDDLPF